MKRFTILTAALLMSFGVVGGCSDGDNVGACYTGSDPMASWAIRPARCGEGGCDGQFMNWSVTGDASVVSLVTGAPGEYTIELYFVDDATTVALDVTLPDAAALPFAAGEQVRASVTFDSPWWTEESAAVYDLDGRVLLSMGAGSLEADEPPATCKAAQRECGTVGYPTRFICHPDFSVDPDAPCEELQQGESAVLSYNGTTYKRYLATSYVYTRMDCTDLPSGWTNSLTVKIP